MQTVTAEQTRSKLQQKFKFLELQKDTVSRKKTVLSFSSIKPHKTENEPSDNSQQSFQDDEQYSAKIVAADTDVMPRGKEFGSFLHEMFETVAFSTVAACDSAKALVKHSEFNSVFNDLFFQYEDKIIIDTLQHIKQQTAVVLWHTLHCKLPQLQTSLCTVQDKIHELEFMYSEDNTTYTHGFIDLIVRHAGKFYIIDWKSNFLYTDYSQEMIEKNIKESHYDLQYTIYSATLISWLKKTDPTYSFDSHFGGVFYLYLRGMNAAEQQQGIYFFRAASEAEVFDSLPENVSINSFIE